MSIRKYLTPTELTEREGTASPDQTILNKAESDIDKVIGNFLVGPLVKHYDYTTTPSEQTVLTDTQATLPTANYTDGIFQYTVLEILEGTNKGKRIVIKDNVSNVLTFFDTQIGLNETSYVKIYQFGKLPMYKDVSLLGGKYYKTIPEVIKQAVALQYTFRVQNPSIFNKNQEIAGESISKDSASVSYSTGSSDLSKDYVDKFVSPESKEILASSGYLYYGI